MLFKYGYAVMGDIAIAVVKCDRYQAIVAQPTRVPIDEGVKRDHISYVGQDLHLSIEIVGMHGHLVSIDFIIGHPVVQKYRSAMSYTQSISSCAIGLNSYFETIQKIAAANGVGRRRLVNMDLDPRTNLCSTAHCKVHRGSIANIICARILS
ncbi:hypothetical protein [Specibacter sp. NPDC078709]|uniref:hypothetical protein n=1 Tax=Specibacter sp. NPDC078709 TaxID=3154364 RepID=UPI00343DFD81